MKFKLICSKKNEYTLRKQLENAGFDISDDADFVISEYHKPKDFLMGRIHETYEVLPLNTILYIETFGKEVIAHTQDQQYVLSEKLYQLEEQLGEQGFIRVNKSQLINIKHILEINPWFGQKYNITMKNHTEIDVNRTYYKRFKAYFGI
ncbi:LytTR family transcriptional regulator [Vallitalea pronyensis]|uniref:LytTR family transcriptional regulator n=1 Tax=Vallitalea pronyensis TaxID=1348613 RepID=A0A8J8MM97_9FIRM|nr:LytTR family DNA-binding domain-containing protein [Vallitalea pronyensis]QUI23898.1 LytTR family transcriptional regulator [Vallitalea pronyensis]